MSTGFMTLGYLSRRASRGWFSEVVSAMVAHPLVTMVVIAAGLEQAISYQKVYLYHAVVALGYLAVFLTGFKIKRRAWHAWIAVFGGLVIWVLLWPTIRYDTVEALKYTVVIFVGLAGTLLLFLRIRSIGALKAAVGGLVAVEVVNAVFGYLEYFDLYHLESKTRWLVDAGLDTAGLASIERIPSAFSVNPNNFAIAMLIPIAFAVAWWLKRQRGRWWAIIGLLPFTVVVFILTESRGAGVGLVLLLTSAGVWWQRMRLIRAIVFAGVLLMAILLIVPLAKNTLGNTSTLSFLDPVALQEPVSLVSYALSHPNEAVNWTYEQNGSIGVRIAWIIESFQAVIQTGGLGLGPGGLVHIHNMYGEVLANAGVLGFVILISTGFWLIRKSFRLSLLSTPLLGTVGLACFLFWIGFSIAVTTVSTIFYFLPMHMMLGISLAAFNLQSMPGVVNQTARIRYQTRWRL